ncbi:YWFCY domain-containing protein [Larkinella humicola]|uniref:TraM recognition domain-containing protein n=1 Tax=Larkinella humicola TaxID=2607654 RepID=A0A5N1J8P9_9BACT|nr:YWFCY domain-containing protein [Larkinella humicola]KAA9341190.1 TraM recognition domain-containing protein [Larkinella humicola]
MRDDRKDQAKINEIALWASIIFLLTHFFLEWHGLFKSLGWSNPFVDNLIRKLLAGFGLLASPWPLKLLAAGAIVTFGISSRGVKSVTLKPRIVITDLAVGAFLFLGSTFLVPDSTGWLVAKAGMAGGSLFYLTLTVVGLLYLLKGSQGINRLILTRIGKDTFNKENETFPQEERLLTNPHSVNISTEFEYQGRMRRGWINIVNTFRGILIVGSAGSGKTYSLINAIIRQQIEKGFSMYIYDFKFSDLSLVAFNALMRYRKNQPKNLKFYCINFDDPVKSHRCNPLHPVYLDSIEDAYESAKMVMMNLNKKWIGKEGEFFVDTPIAYVTCMIWLLRTYKDGIFCTLPHVIELLTIDYRKVFPLMVNRPDLESRAAIFVSALEGGAMDQLEGQMASARSGPAKLSSPNLYWTMSGNGFMLDINNPDEPKIVCVGNNSKKKKIYGAALSLYNGRILNLINQKGKRPCGVIIDEIPTMFFEGIGDLINTGRSNKISVTLAMQDYSQLDAEYGKEQAEVIKNSCGTVICGQASGATAEAMQNRLGKNVQRKENINIQSEDTTHGISTELNFIAPAAKISQLSQGEFVGVVADTVEQPSELKAFRAKVLVDEADFNDEQKYKELPNFSIFAQEEDLKQMVQNNYLQIKADTKAFVDDETARVANELGLSPKKP